MSTETVSSGGRGLPRLRQLLIAAVAAGVGLLLAWLLLTGKPRPEPGPRPELPPPVVNVVVAEPAARVLPVQTQGTVEAHRRIGLVAEVGGKIIDVAAGFSDGEFFSRDDVLLRIEPDDYEFAIARAQSQVAAAQQRLAEERGRNLQAKREWRELGSDAANSLFLREPQMRAAEAALEAAHADVAAAELALARTRIRAPFDGRIETIRVDLGQFVSPGAPVADIYATDRVEIRLPLNDDQLGALQLPTFRNAEQSRPVTLTARFGGETWTWSGVIRGTDAVVDRQSRVVNAIAEVEDAFLPGERTRPALTPGMFVQAEIATPPIPGLVELPATALRADDSLLVVDSDGRLVRRVVEVRRRDRNRAWVVGLDKGERVVAVQTGVLVAGSRVDAVVGAQ